MPAQTTIQVRRGTAASWTSTNPTLAAGEVGFETDTGKFKIGTGSAVWTSLSYFNPGNTSPLTTKGDLYTYSTTDARLPVGSNGYTLVADSSTSTGLAYSPTFFAGKNKIINGDFYINQRNFTSVTAHNTYTFDRWKSTVVGNGTVTFTPQTFTAGTAPVAGYEGRNFIQIVTSGQSSTDALAQLQQPIEDARTFAGQTVTISFWIKAASGTPSIAALLVQNFGSGGSPSAEVQTVSAKTAISTTWTRYSFTLNIPSISGKTFGTNNDSSLIFRIAVSGGSNYDSYFGYNLGIQNNTFQIWGVQVEAGSTATQFQTATGTIQGELAACQRYYWRHTPGVQYGYLGIGTATSTTNLRALINIPPMRVAPTSFDYSTLAVGNAAGVLNSVSSATVEYSAPNTQAVNFVTTGLTAGNTFLALANSTTAYIGFSAEL